MIVLEVLLLAFLVFCALATVLGKKMVSCPFCGSCWSPPTWPSPRPPWGRE